jgi:predicted Zn-dependent peptidase
MWNDLRLQITKKAADVLRGAKFTQEDATRAKGILKGDIALSLETDAGLLESLGTQSLLSGKASTLAELLSVVDSVSAEDMNAVS